VPDELFRRLASGSTTLSGIFASLPFPGRHVLETDMGQDLVQAHLVTGTYFAVLGVDAVVGRTLTQSDDDAGVPEVAVISHRLWQRHFGGDPDVVGKTIDLVQSNGRIGRAGVIVVGVASPGFHGVDVDGDPDVWVPFRVLGSGMFSDGDVLGGLGGVRVMGRMHERVSVSAVETEVDVLASQLTDLDLGLLRGEAGRFSVLIHPGGRGYSRLRYEFLEPVVALSAAVGVVLLIVWTNLAALMLGRGAFRCREMAIRRALGSEPRRLLGLFLREGLILALAGGSLGFVFAFWGTEFLTSWIPPESVLASRIQPGWRTLVFTGAVSMLGMVVFAFLPGVKGASMAIALPVAGPSGRTGRRGAFAMGHRIAVVLQIALSLYLLTGMGLLLRTLGNLGSVDVGFDEHEVLQFEIESPQSSRLRDFAETGLARIGSLPGAQSTSYYYGTQGLLQEDIVLPPLELSLGPGGPTISAREVWVGPRFFETLGIPLVSGRTHREEFVDSGPDTLSEGVRYLNRGELVLSAGLAARLFEAEDPIGRRVLAEFGFRAPPERPEGPVFVRYDVVGVVGDVRHLSLRNRPDSTVYMFTH
jgi:predicted permease